MQQQQSWLIQEIKGHTIKVTNVNSDIKHKYKIKLAAIAINPVFYFVVVWEKYPLRVTSAQGTVQNTL